MGPSLPSTAVPSDEQERSEQLASLLALCAMIGPVVANGVDRTPVIEEPMSLFEPLELDR